LLSCAVNVFGVDKWFCCSELVSPNCWKSRSQTNFGCHEKVD